MTRIIEILFEIEIGSAILLHCAPSPRASHDAITKHPKLMSTGDNREASIIAKAGVSSRF